MENEESKQLLLKLLALADRMEQRDAHVIQQLAQQTSGLQITTQEVRENGRKFADEVLDVLRSQGREAIGAGIGQAMAEGSRQLQQSVTQVARASEEVRASASALSKQRNLWLWTAPIALVIGSLLAAGGSSWWVWRNAAELKRTEFSQDILQATRTGALTRCGDGSQLCVRVGADAKRYGSEGEYILLQE